MPAIEQSIEVVRRFAAERAQTADIVLLGGSRAKGTDTEGSDFDVVLLYRMLQGSAWREMVSFEGYDFEVFAHDLGSLTYFVEKLERQARKPVLMRLVIEGEPVITRDAELLQSAKDIASRAYARGPTVCERDSLEHQRYAITDLAESIRTHDSATLTVAAGAALYTALAMFALCGSGRWLASGKAIPGALAAMQPGLDQEFQTAFLELFRTGADLLVQKLVDAVLAPYGGRLRSGFRQTAPSSWRE